MDPPSQRSVLLSEDVERLLRQGESFLARSGFRLAAGKSDAEILDKAARVRPDAVVLSCRPDALEAEEVCRALKRTAPALPVVVIGPARPADAARRLKEAGCDEFLPAPADVPALLTRLAALLGLRFRIHPRKTLVAPVAYGRVVREFLGYTRNLSESGVLVESVLDFRPGRKLVLRLYPDDGDPLVLPAVVVRVQASPADDLNLFGMQFRPLPAATRARLKTVLERPV